MTPDDDAILIPRYLLRTLAPSGYLHRFYLAVQASGLNHREAYDAIEADREAHGLPPGYASYESFKRAKSFHMGKLFRLLED